MLLISETKIDNTFPWSQFCVPGYSVPFRLDRTGNGGGIILYVKEYIPCRMLNKFTFETEVEAFAIEINLCKVLSGYWSVLISQIFVIYQYI